MNKHTALLSKLPFWGSCGGFLCLLLLLVTACTDEGREVAEIHQSIQESDQVELFIRTQIPEMEIGSRAVTEKITAITAFAFDGDTNESVLIKKVNATLSNNTDTTGTLKIKVPKRTRSIHFVAKNNGSYDAGEYTLGETTLNELLLNKTTTELHYWGMLTFANAEALNANSISLTLYRNMAKVVLTSKVDAGNDYIAGFLNYNGNATLVPHDGNGTLGYQQNVVTLPQDPGLTSHNTSQNLDTEYLLSEHANEESNRLYAICYIGGKYYKIAFSNSNGEFFPLVRNHLYRIVINQISGGSDSYDAAKNADPINGKVREETMNVTTVPLTSYKGNTSQVTVTIPNGVTSLSVNSLPEQFEISSTDVSPVNGVYNVSGKQSVNFTLTLKDEYIGTTGKSSISFTGSGTSVNATGIADVTLNGFMDMYEMYFDSGNSGGSNEYDKFFYDRNNVNIQTQTLSTQYVDAGANNSSLAHNHTNAAINMQSNSAITFTITDIRYLTLLVARNGNAPNINLLKDGEAWTETSDDAQVPATYNFSKEGDITTSGRLIRYELPAGTYTLQRGNNDYLLYYMRISTEKPTMTDILQPTAGDYSLSWSGGEYGNWTYVENVGYVVDDDAKTFNVALTDGFMSNNSITDGELSLNSLHLNVTNSSFNNNSTDYTNTNNSSNIEISEINSGTYTYTIGAGVINNPEYKYTNFYDKISVNAVNGDSSITVKNSLKLKLVNGETSYNGKENIVEYYTSDMSDPRLAIVSPATPLKPQGNNSSFVCTIQENWQFKGANNKQIESNGQQINLVSQSGNTFTIANGTEHYDDNNNWQHPFWMTYIYYFDWGSFTDENNANRTLSDITISTEDADVWFSYKGMDIAKRLTIKVNENPGEVVEPEGLDIALDFYTDTEGANGGSGPYTNNNLVFGETNLYLKVTIPDGVAAGTRIELDMETGGTREWINEWGSRNETLSDGVNYRYNNGITGLEITAQEGKRDYLMCWTFIRSDNNIEQSVPITYTLKSEQHSLSGETSANLTITGNNKQIQVSAHNINKDGKINVPLEYGIGTTDEFTVDVTVPAGVTGITITADDFNVSWSNGNGSVSTDKTFTFAESAEQQTKRFKFTLIESNKSQKSSNIVFHCEDKYVADGIVTVNLSPRAADSDGGTTIWSGLAQLEWSVNYLSIPNTIARGSTVRINFTTTGGAFKLHDGNGKAFKLSNEDYTHQQDNDTYLNTTSGQTYYEFKVNNIYEGTDITNGLQGLKINGDNVTVTSIAVYEGGNVEEEENVIFEYDFTANTPNNLWSPDRTPTYDSTNGFCLSNPEKLNDSWQPQYHLANGLTLEAGTYTITMKIRGSVAGQIDKVGLGSWEEGVGQTYSNSAMTFTTEWQEKSVQVTLTQATGNGAGFVMCQSGGFIGDLYIQTLKVVKNN